MVNYSLLSTNIEKMRVSLDLFIAFCGKMYVCKNITIIQGMKVSVKLHAVISRINQHFGFHWNLQSIS